MLVSMIANLMLNQLLPLQHISQNPVLLAIHVHTSMSRLSQ
jgi:hypothetical protein